MGDNEGTEVLSFTKRTMAECKYSLFKEQREKMQNPERLRQKELRSEATCHLVAGPGITQDSWNTAVRLREPGPGVAVSNR